MNKRTIITLIGVAAIIGISFSGMSLLGKMKKKPVKMKQPEIKRFVKADRVTYQSLNSKVEASGRVTSHELFDIGSEVQGKILKSNTPLKAGQLFKKGDILISIDDREATLNLLGKKSKFLNTVAVLLPDFKVDFPESLEKWTSFFENISLDKDLPSFPGTDSPKEKIFLASRNILSDYFAIKSDEVRLKKYQITAPFTGTYQEVFLEEGAIANPGSKIARVIGTENLELEVPVPVNTAVWVNIGDMVDVFSEVTGTRWNGEVIRISEFIEPSTQSLTVFIKVKSQKNQILLDGLYLTAVFNNISVENAMEIPRNAVFNQNEVFVVKNGKLNKKIINIKKINNETILFDGIEDGLMVVTEPLINAVENMKVQILR